MANAGNRSWLTMLAVRSELGACAMTQATSEERGTRRQKMIFRSF